MEARTRILDLVNHWEEAQDAGEDVSLAVLCKDCPELVSAVASVIEQLRGFAQIAPIAMRVPCGDSVPEHARYLFTKIIGQGGMGEVWEGVDVLLNRSVAIKILFGRTLAKEQKDRVLGEASLLNKLESPGIVPVYDIGELNDGRPFLVMKLITGKTLGQLFNERPTPLHNLGHWVLVFEKICRIVGFAHSRNVLHRDLKPANVMVDDQGEVYVMDWGIGKLQEEKYESAVVDPTQPHATTPRNSEGTVSTFLDRTVAGQIKGTSAYMAPEQARGEPRRISTRSDVFGLGGILCTLLTGRPTYASQAGEDPLEKAKQADLGESLGRLDASGAELELIALARWCLSPEPRERPSKATEVTEVIESYCQLQRLRSSLPPRGPGTQHAAKYHLILALLPHAIGACLVTTYSLLWAALYWHEAFELLAGILIGYTAVSFLVTGVYSRLLLAFWLRVWRRLESGGLVTEEEIETARHQALRLPIRSLGLSAVGWLPGCLLVPWLLSLGTGTWNPFVFVYFVLAFSIVGLMAGTYTALNSNYLIVRVAYPYLWRLPRELPRTVRRELSEVPTRFRLLSALANLVPLITTEVFLVISATLDSEQFASPAGRLFLGLAILLVALGMLGTVLAGRIAQYLKNIVDDYFVVLNGGK